MKLKLLTSIALLFCLSGYGQKAPATVPEHYRLWLVDSSKQSNIDKVQDVNTQRNSEAISAEQKKWVTILPASLISINANSEVDVKLAPIVAQVISQIPTPPTVDLTGILSRLTTAENKIENLTTENTALKNRTTTLEANGVTLNERLSIAEQINNILATQITALQQTIKDTAISIRVSNTAYQKITADTVTSLRKQLSGTNTAVYVRVNACEAKIVTSDSKIAALDVRVKKLELKP